MVRVLILVLVEHFVAKELRGAERLVDVLEGLGVKSDPGKHHDTLSHGTELSKVGRAAVGLLDVTDGDEGLLDGLDEFLVEGRLGAHVGLLSLCGDEEEGALLLKAIEDLCGLLGDDATKLVAGVDILLDG